MLQDPHPGGLRPPTFPFRLEPPIWFCSTRPSDTRQPHAEGCDDLFALLAAVIAKTHTGGAVHALPFCGV